MTKTQLGDLLVKAAALLRQVARERDSYKEKLAAMEKSARVQKIAAEMRAKGINTHLSEEELISDLMKQAEKGQLDIIEQALKLSSPGNFAGFYKIADNDKPSSVSAAKITSFLMTGD